MTERSMEIYRKALERLAGAAFNPGSVSFASIPARPEEDADTLLAFALDDLERMRRERDTCTSQESEELVTLRAQNAELLEALVATRKAWVYEASQGDGIMIEHDRIVDSADAAIAKAKGGVA